MGRHWRRRCRPPCRSANCWKDGAGSGDAASLLILAAYQSRAGAGARMRNAASRAASGPGTPFLSAGAGSLTRPASSLVEAAPAHRNGRSGRRPSTRGERTHSLVDLSCLPPVFGLSPCAIRLVGTPRPDDMRGATDLNNRVPDRCPRCPGSGLIRGPVPHGSRRSPTSF